MKKILSIILSILLGLTILAAVIWYIGFEKIYQAIHNFSWFGFFIVILVTVVVWVPGIFKLKIILKTQGFDIPIMKLFSVRIAGQSVTYLTPSLYLGGEPIRAYMLKKEDGVPFTNGISSITIEKALDATFAVLFGILGIIFVILEYSLPFKLKIILATLVLLGTIGIAFFYLRALSKKGLVGPIIDTFKLHEIGFLKKKRERIYAFDRQIADFFNYKKEFYTVLVLSFLTWFLTFLKLWIVVYFLGYTVGVVEILIIFTLSVFSGVMPFIPASFGTFELTQVFIFALLGMGAETGVAFSFIIRCADFIWIAVGLIILSSFGIRLTQVFSKKFQSNNNLNSNKL